MSEGVKVWQGSQRLSDLGSTMKKTTANASLKLVRTILKNAFWSFIVITNVAIIGDLLLNNGNNLIDLFFNLTGGYSR